MARFSMYRLKYDPRAEAVHDSMPPDARGALTFAFEAACHDPVGATEQYGDVEDDVMRTVVTEHAIAVLLVGHTLKTVTVLQINYLG
jgi:hypothetical protein